MSLLIVQPWFTAVGHPARSLLNTARALGVREDVSYLISDPGVGELSETAQELRRYGSTTLFNSRGPSLRTGTLLSLPAVLRLVRGDVTLNRVFFFDADLVSLAMAWPLASTAARGVQFLGLLCVREPGRIASHPLARYLVTRFLSSPGRRLFLRTNELMEDWRTSLPDVPAHHIDCLPSLEIVDAIPAAPPPDIGKTLRFGVIGQVRKGKSLDWLVPLFVNNASIGILHVAGALANSEHRDGLSFLMNYSNFDNRFLTESEMLLAASNQDYLVALYDDWDARMEAATVYLGAQVGRPVIVYDEGWTGRMIREFGCGIAIARSPRPGSSFFAGLPRPGEASYGKLLEGVWRFREAHDSKRMSGIFLDKLSAHAPTS